MLVEFASLDHAIAAVVQRCMSESLSGGVRREPHITAVLTALKEAWPIEYATSSSRVMFVPHATGGVRAMFREQEAATT